MPAVPALWKALCSCAVHHRPGPHLLHWPGGVPWAVFVPRIAFTCWESGALHWIAELGRHPTTSEWEARLMMTFVPWLMRRLKFWGKLSSVRSFPPPRNNRSSDYLYKDPEQKICDLLQKSFEEDWSNMELLEGDRIWSKFSDICLSKPLVFAWAVVI